MVDFLKNYHGDKLPPDEIPGIMTTPSIPHAIWCMPSHRTQDVLCPCASAQVVLMVKAGAKLELEVSALKTMLITALREYGPFHLNIDDMNTLKVTQGMKMSEEVIPPEAEGRPLQRFLILSYEEKRGPESEDSSPDDSRRP